MNRRRNKILTISIFVTLILFSNVDILNAQNRTWLNYEVGITASQQSWNTQLSNLHILKPTNSIVGGYIEQELNHFLSIESGINDKFYGFDAYYFGSDSLSTGAYAQCVQIPLRLRTRINLLNNKLFLSPHVGLGLLIKSYDGILIFPEGKFDIEVKTAFPKTALLIETGLSLELILKSWKFAFLATASINYTGKDFINYSIKDMNTSFSTTGSYVTYQIRVGYAISNIWNRKKK